MHRRIGVLTLCSAAILAIALPASASALTKTVSAGPPGNGLAKKVLGKAFLKKYAPDVNAFFLQRVTINQGDSVKFVINGFHDIDLPGTTGKDLPLLLPGPLVTGANDAAGVPFWFNGLRPSLGINPALFSKIGGSTYDGTSRIDSGITASKLTVKFTKPGTYKYFCDVHPGMVGYVVVRATGKSIPSAAQDAAAATKQQLAALAAVKKAAKVKPPANEVDVGSAGAGGAEDYTMFPATLHVSKGTVVTFTMTPDSREAHTATFGPVGYLTTLANSITSPAPKQQVWYPSDPPMSGPVQQSATSHGNGFANTGVLDEDPTTPNPVFSKIKFLQKGTYHYICLIHPFMRGTIVVQ